MVRNILAEKGQTKSRSEARENIRELARWNTAGLEATETIEKRREILDGWGLRRSHTYLEGVLGIRSGPKELLASEFWGKSHGVGGGGGGVGGGGERGAAAAVRDRSRATERKRQLGDDGCVTGRILTGIDRLMVMIEESCRR